MSDFYGDCHRKVLSILSRASKLVRSVIRRSIVFFFSPVLKPLLRTELGREVLFEAMPRNHLILASTTEGLNYLVNTSDKVIGKSIYRTRKSYDSHHLTVAVSLISSPRSILLDVGANLGTIGILGVSQGYFQKCIAFEPEPNNFELLRSNVFLNGFEDKFELRNEAASNERVGTLDFELSEKNFGDHRVQIQRTSGRNKENRRKVISVNVNTLDSVVEKIDADECVIFMDTQGFEGHVLSGAKRLIQNSVPIVMEFWPYGLDRSKGLNLLYETLSNSQYTSMWDLSNPERKIEFSIDKLKQIADNLGPYGAFTDLVLIDERKICSKKMP